MNVELLQQTITRAFASHPGLDAYEEGLCGEFAFALKQFLAAQGVTSSVITGIRKEIDNFRDDPEPFYSFSHVVVNALGTAWDVKGQNAVNRWEQMWDSLEPETSSRFEWLLSRYPSSFRRKYKVKPFNTAESYLVLQRLEEAFIPI